MYIIYLIKYGIIEGEGGSMKCLTLKRYTMYATMMRVMHTRLILAKFKVIFTYKLSVKVIFRLKS